MKAIQVAEYLAGPRELAVSEIPAPAPAPDQYTIAVRACAANFFDLLQIRGKYQHQPPLPWVSGAEFSGVIVATPTTPTTTSSSASSAARPPRFRVGDRVFGSAQGAYAERVCAAEAQLQPLPRGWSFRDAAGLFVTMPTAYAGLVTRARLGPGDWVLVHAGAGGVGLAAVQIAKARGATVVATAGSRRKLDVATRFGADYAVDYRRETWPAEVLRLTPRQRGVDVVYDPVGLIDKSQKCIAWNGRLVVIGFAGGEIERMATNRILLKNISVVGLHWGAYATHEPHAVPEVWRELHRLFESKAVRATTYTDRLYRGLPSVPAALEALGARDTWGKVVVDLAEMKDSKL